MNEVPVSPSTARAGGMLCPVCKVALSLSDRQGIEIDYCPQCRGVWLDRGELDKIIERSDNYAAAPAAAPAPAQPAQPAPYAPGTPVYDPYYGEGHHGSRHGGARYDPRRGGFLGRLFDHH